MDIRYHYVRELVHRKQVSVTYCPSSQMTADMLTKPLDFKTFLSHRTPLLGNLVCGGGVDLVYYIFMQTKFYIILTNLYLYNIFINNYHLYNILYNYKFVFA